MPNAQKANLLRGKDLITSVVSHNREFIRLTCGCEIHLTKGGSPYERN